jgi:hypothetical protein
MEGEKCNLVEIGLVFLRIVSSFLLFISPGSPDLALPLAGHDE